MLLVAFLTHVKFSLSRPGSGFRLLRGLRVLRPTGRGLLLGGLLRILRVLLRRLLLGRVLRRRARLLLRILGVLLLGRSLGSGGCRLNRSRRRGFASTGQRPGHIAGVLGDAEDHDQNFISYPGENDLHGESDRGADQPGQHAPNAAVRGEHGNHKSKPDQGGNDDGLKYIKA